MLTVRWTVNGNCLIRKINVIGKVLEREYEDDWVSYALPQALRIIDIAERYRGKLIHYKKTPTINAKEAIYFEIIFENLGDYNSFTASIPKEL